VPRERLPSLADLTRASDAPPASEPAGGDHHIVIDLTGTTPTGRPLRSVFDRHRWIALALVAAVASVLAIVNFAVGMQWRSLALDAQDRAAQAAADAAAKQQAVTAANDARDTAEMRREVMAKQLAVSEADVAALEARVSTLANEKARAEDYSGSAITRADSDARIRSLRAQLNSCVAQVSALRTSLLVDDPTSVAVDETASAAEASCEQAGADVAVLAARK
jgi:hypothetical protein